MQLHEWIGSIGVAILLTAYVLDLLNWIPDDSTGFLWMNAIGAGLASASAAMIPFWPFVILEGVWSLVSFIALIARGVRRLQR